MTELREKLGGYKERKNTKKQRRAKWENWKKTQAMFYCKTSTNYNKWDVFESSESDENDKDPIVPKDDPAFKAMEKDFDDRAQRRTRDRKLAEALKVKGNEAMKRGLYKSAKQHYSDALEIKKDALQLYTNRALVCLRLEQPQQVIDDCSRVIEYCEVFDNGYDK
jgi:tetratricopeptide (TPR) repeat protein